MENHRAAMLVGYLRSTDAHPKWVKDIVDDLQIELQDADKHSRELFINDMSDKLQASRQPIKPKRVADAISESEGKAKRDVHHCGTNEGEDNDISGESEALQETTERLPASISPFDDTKKETKSARVRRIIADYPDLSYSQIAQRAGCNVGLVSQVKHALKKEAAAA